MYPTDAKKQFGLPRRLAYTCLSVVCLYALISTTYAATGLTETESVYIDSVYSWGAWEHGIEPATGPRAPADRSMNNRSRELQFRPNDNATYTTSSVPRRPVTIISPPAPVPARPIVPASPSIPVIRPDGSGPLMPGAIPSSPSRRR